MQIVIKYGNRYSYTQENKMTIEKPVIGAVLRNK